MNRPSRPGVLDLQFQYASTSTRARSRSDGSVDKPLSSNGSSIRSLAKPQLTNVSPEPAYIAASAATVIVTGNHEDFLQDETNAGLWNTTPTIPVTPASLKLINQFLDFLLHSFLSAAKSTTLKALRPAVSEVLRSRLAKEAVAGADQELSSYVGGGDDGDGGHEDFDVLSEFQESSADWDLDATWKRTRLRCMVYSSLGDIEEDDEDVYLGYDNLEGIVGSQQYEQNSVVLGVVSPAVAIWLTAILEFMGEQTLLLAGHAAISRFRQRMAAVENEDHGKNDVRERPMVEELDTEKVALNSSLGRLWRQWRKHVRGRGSSFSVPGHHGVILQRLERTASRMSSNSTLASTLVEPGNPQTGASEPPRTPEKVITTTCEGLKLNAGEVGNSQCKESNSKKLLTVIVETLLAIDEFAGATTTPPKLDVDGGYLAPGTVEDSQKRRPRSLVLPWTTTEAPFILRSSSLQRPRSMPAITRSDFPDPIVEGVVGVKDQGTESEDNNLEFFTPTEDRINSATSALRVFELESEGLVPLERSSSAAERFEKLTVAKFRGDDATRIIEPQILDEAESPEVVPMPDRKDAEPRPVLDRNGDAIRLARTSDILVSLPASRSSSLHNPDVDDENESQEFSQELHFISASHTADQQKYEKFPQPSSKRSAELIEIRTTGCASTFQEQRAADRRPSATTLNESLENTVTSDDDSSFTTSQKDFKGERLTPGGSGHVASDYFAHSKPTSSASSKYSQNSQLSDRKLGQLTLIQPPGSTTSLPVERMRAWTPPQTPNKSRRSSSFGKIQRPVTAHSGTSQSSTKLKSFISWPMENGKQMKPIEPDDDSGSSLYSERPSIALASLDKERSFEELISSGDTIHCTITPDPLRRMETKEVPRTATSDLADFLRNTGPDGKELHVAPPSRSGNSSRPATARAIPIIPKDSSVDDTTTLVHLLRSTSTSPTETRPQTPTPLIPSLQISTHSPKTQPEQRAGSEVISPMTTGFRPTPFSPSSITGIPAVLRQNRSDSHDSRPKNRLVARDASGSRTSDSTSALADFFRNTTPPIDTEGHAAQRRISRSVAPFRTTLDSDQFELPEGSGRVSDRVANNETPPNELIFLSSAAPPPDSYQSFSSSTALLRSTSKKQHDYGAVGSMSETRRKQSRVKDPYAIDIDELNDDDDIEALSLIIPKAKGENESLIDFLRNVPPPPQPPTLPAETDAIKIIQKKNSSVSLISRFGRSSRKNSIASNTDKFALPPIPPMPEGYKHTAFPQEGDHSPRYMQAGEQRRPAFNSRMDTEPTNTTTGARFGNRSPQVRGAVQARGARIDQDNTDSLADFLKYSEPPPITHAPTAKEDNGAMSKFKHFTFSKKSKRNELSGLV